VAGTFAGKVPGTFGGLPSILLGKLGRGDNGILRDA
jgi:hypothetical protein